MKYKLNYELSNYSGLKPVLQTTLITRSWLGSIFFKDFPVLNLKGVCQGLCIDYARFTLKNPNRNSDYVDKLNTKFTLFGKSSRNFANRINLYLFAFQFENGYKIPQKKGQAINHDFLSSQEPSLLSMTFVGQSGEGHVISIRKVMDGKVFKGYKIYDPNFGEFDFSNNDVNLNITNFNNIVEKLTQFYAELGMTSPYLSDLEKIVKDYDIVKDKKRKTIATKALANCLLASGSVSQLKMILEAGADVNDLIQPYNRPPLAIAIANSNFEAIELLLEHKADANVVYNQGEMLLIAQCHDVRIIELLLKYGANINLKDEYGETALFSAVRGNNLKKLEFLLEKGAKNEPNNSGITPFEYVIREGKTEMLKLFIDSNLDLKDKIAKANLHLHGENPEFVKILLEQGAPVNQKDKISGETLLHHAVESKDIEMVKLLLKHGAKIDIKDKDGIEALPATVDNPELKELRNQYLSQKESSIEEKKSELPRVNSRNLAHRYTSTHVTSPTIVVSGNVSAAISKKFP